MIIIRHQNLSTLLLVLWLLPVTCPSHASWQVGPYFYLVLSIKPCLHCQKFGSKWRTRVLIESLMAAKSCKEMYGISTKIQNTTTTSHNIP